MLSLFSTGSDTSGFRKQCPAYGSKRFGKEYHNRCSTHFDGTCQEGQVL